MNSAISFLLNRARGATGSRFRRSPAFLFPAGAKLHCTETSKPPRRRSLTTTIFNLGHSNTDVSPELDRWLAGGNDVLHTEIRNITHGLRNIRRIKQALQVSEWRKDKWESIKGGKAFIPSDHAVHLVLLAQVRGISAAEMYFEGLKDEEKNGQTYCALLNCYVREGLVDESLSHMKKMKELGMASSPLPYNNIMRLYAQIGQHEKVPLVMEEMKNNKILPDNFSYQICINSLGTSSDIEGMKKVLEEMEAQPQMAVDWNTYIVNANLYIKAGLNEKAISMLKKSEERLKKNDKHSYYHLISLYCLLGNKQEILRLWELMKENGNKLSKKDYMSMLKTLIKLGELEEAEELLKDWESSGNFFDFQVPNILLVAYQQRGLMEKAEEMVNGYLKKGRNPFSNSWEIVATGYVEKGDLGKACEFMTNALRAYTPTASWLPSSKAVKSILQYLGDEGEVEAVEEFVGLLKTVVPASRDVYHTLIKCNLRAGKDIDEFLEKMKSEGIEPNEDTQDIISSFNKSQDFVSI